MVITIASWKGGQGKSTTAIHLGRFYQDYAPTLVADHDPNRTALCWADGNTSRKFTVVTEAQLGIEAMSGKYRVVINDTPARPEHLDLAGLAKGASIVVIPCTPDIFSLRTVLEAARAFSDLNAQTVRVLLTSVPPLPQRDGAMAREALESRGIPVFKTQIRLAKAFKHAQAMGGFVQDVRDGLSLLAWSDYEAFGSELNELLDTEAAQAATAGSIHG